MKAQFSSVQFICSVVSDSVTPWLKLTSSSQWCHPAISSSVIPFSSCPQSLPASQSFPMSQLFTWGGPSTGVSALASFLPKNTQGWSPLEWTGWISNLFRDKVLVGPPGQQTQSHIHDLRTLTVTMRIAWFSLLVPTPTSQFVQNTKIRCLSLEQTGHAIVISRAWA